MKKILYVIILFLYISITLHADWQDFVPDKYEETIETLCKEYNVPIEIAISIAITESNFQNVIGRNRYSFDIGIFQLNSIYISYYENKFWKKSTAFNPYNPLHNIEIGIAIIGFLYQQINNWPDTIRAYNLGLTGLRDNEKVCIGNTYFIRVTKIIMTL